MVTPTTTTTSSAVYPNNDNHSHARERQESDDSNDDGYSQVSDIEIPNRRYSKQTCTLLKVRETPKNFLWPFEYPSRGQEVEDSDTTRIPPALSSSSYQCRMSLTTVTANNDKNRDINFELWTQRYVGAEGNLNAIQLDTFRGQSLLFAKNAQLYPNKLRNLQRRVMRVGTLTYVPYVKTNYVVSSRHIRSERERERQREVAMTMTTRHKQHSGF